MAELVTLTTPIAKPSQTTVRLQLVTLDIEGQSITVQWLGNNNEPGIATYPTPAPQGSAQPTGATLLSSLNTANFAANSLVHHIFTRLLADGYLPAGTVGGTPV